MTTQTLSPFLSPSAAPAGERATFCLVRSAAFAGLAVGSALLAVPVTHAAAPSLPTGAQTVSGASTVSQSGTTLTVTQTTDKAATNWQSFNIGAGHTVNFVQPSASAVSLNRVIGNDVSVIQGALNANGHVFLLNPNGVLFTSTAQVNVGGIVASTLRMNTEDFMAGRYTFEGAGSGTIVNQGNITAAKGGVVGLISAKVTNTGSIVAPEGSVVAGAGNRVTLDLGGPIKIKVEEGVLEALIEQGGAIRADGGLVYLTAKAVGEVTRTVLNHTGITEAKTLSAGKDGKIYLMGGMEKDRIVVAGKLDASAPNGGNGGFVETSAAHVQIEDEARVTTAASKGKTGTWLIDPINFSIGSGSGAQTTSSIGTVTLGTALKFSNVTIQTDSSTAGNGDITLNGVVTRAYDSEQEGPTTLTLAAHRDIIMGATTGIAGSEGAPLNIVLAARATGLPEGSIQFSQTYLRSYGGNITIGGGDLAASGAAIGRNGLSGVYMQISVIDATANGASAGASGKAEDNTVIPTSAGGGNIVIRGQAGSSGDYGMGSGIGFDRMTIVTGGNGAITLRGTGGPNRASSESSEGIKIKGSFIKAKDGLITLEGFQGTGYNRYGITTFQGFSRDFSTMVVTILNPFIGTNGAIHISGDSLALHDGDLQLYSGQASDISAPVIGWAPNNEAYSLTKTGPGVLTLLGNASGWTAPAQTIPSKTTGTFTDANTTVFDGVTRAQALYGFGVTAQTAVYLRLNTGLSSVYGNTPAFTYSLYDASSGGTAITDALPSGTALWTGGPTAPSSVGSYNLTYSSGITLDSSSYLLNPGGAVLYSVNPRPVTVTPDGKTKVYGDADPLLTYSITSGNLIGADQLTGTLTRALGNNVGNRLISASGFNAEGINPNYAVTIETGNLAISQRPITITAAAKTKVYGDEDPLLTYSITSGNLVGEDSLSLTRATGNNAGNYAISAPVLANYTITSAGADFSITPKPISVTINAQTKVYGNEDPLLTYSITSGNLVGEDSLSLTRATGNNAGNYAISAPAPANANYTITSAGANFGITPRPLSVTIAAKTKVYGNEDPLLTYSVTSGNLVGEDSLSLTRATGNNAGNYAISAPVLANANYTITSAGADFSITPRPLSVTINAQTKVYGNEDPLLTYSITSGNLVGEESLTLTRATGNNAGNYAISAPALANYTITSAGANFSITPRPLSVTIAAKTKVYGNEDPLLTYSITSGNLVGEDSLSLTRATGNNAGNYAISAPALANANYTITPAGGVFTITPKPITITANAATKVYGTEDPELTYITGEGKVVGDVFTGLLARGEGNNVGNYTISAAGLTNANYTITPGNASFTITPKPITITADAKTKVYGEADPALTYAITSGNLLESDALTGLLTRTAGSNVGLYTISVAALANENYTITPVDSTLTISQPPVTAMTAVSTVYVIPPTMSRPASAQLNVGLQLVEVAPAATTKANETSAPGAVTFDPVAAAKRAPGTVLVLTGGVKRAEDDKEGNSSKKEGSKR